MSDPTRPHADPDALLESGARRLGLSLKPSDLQAMRRYRDELLRWSERTNLTALRDPVRLVQDGLLDSLACLRLIPDSVSTAVDIGSGAGFPAIPLALVRRDIRFTLIEAVRRKTTFLRHVCRLLGLEGVQVVWARAEDVAREAGHAGAYDLAMARAAAHPSRQVILAAPFLAAGGIFLGQLGASCPTAELQEHLRTLGLAVATETPLPDFLGGPRRRLVILRRD